MHAIEVNNITINAFATVYDLSPTTVSSTASTSSTPILLHSIQYISTTDQSGNWTTVYSAPGSGGVSDSCSVGVTYPTQQGSPPSPGTYFVQAGASTDGANWTYSSTVTVTVNPALTTHTVYTQAIPKPGLENWFRPSNVVSKPFHILHTNPCP